MLTEYKSLIVSSRNQTSLKELLASCLERKKQEIGDIQERNKQHIFNWSRGCMPSWFHGYYSRNSYLEPMLLLLLFQQFWETRDPLWAFSPIYIHPLVIMYIHWVYENWWFFRLLPLALTSPMDSRLTALTSYLKSALRCLLNSSHLICETAITSSFISSSLLLHQTFPLKVLSLFLSQMLRAESYSFLHLLVFNQSFSKYFQLTFNSIKLTSSTSDCFLSHDDLWPGLQQ